MKFKKIMAGVLAASLAVTSLSIGAWSASGSAAVEVDYTAEGGNYKITKAELDKYTDITVTFKGVEIGTGTEAGQCDHGKNTVAWGEAGFDDSKHGKDDTYCTWGGWAIIGDAANTGVDSSTPNNTKKDTWWQPTSPKKFEGVNATTGEASCTLTVEAILSSITSDPDWKDSFTLNGIILAPWQAGAISSIKGTPKSTDGEGEEDPVTPVESKTLVMNSNSWGEGDAAQYNYQGRIQIKTGLTADQVKALGDVDVKITVLNVEDTQGVTLADLTFAPLLAGSGGDGGWEVDYSKSVKGSKEFTVKFQKSWFTNDKIVGSMTGDISLEVVAQTQSSGTVIAEGSTFNVTYAIEIEEKTVTPPAGGDDTVDVDATPQDNNYKITKAELDKYTDITVTFKGVEIGPNTEAGQCGHDKNTVEWGEAGFNDSKHGKYDTYCTWGGWAIIGDAANTGVDSSTPNNTKKDTWWQPGDTMRFDGVNATTGEGSCTLTVEAILSSITSDPDWKDSFTLNGIILAPWEAGAISSIKGTPKSTDGEGEEDPVTPVEGKTLVMNSNSWGEGADQHNYQGRIQIKTGLTADQVKALGDIDVKITVLDVEDTQGVTLDDLTFAPLLAGSGGDGGWEVDYSKSVTGSKEFTVKFLKSWFTHDKILGYMTGDLSLEVVVQAPSSDAVFDESKAFNVTYAIEIEEETVTPPAGGDDDNPSGGAHVPIISPVASTTEAPATEAPATEASATEAPTTEASATEAPATEAPTEVVTAANGESVEAPADVVPEGAALEVKEQPKEEAVKAVEAVKATDENKEVVETIKKDVEDDKAAVVEIDLVKDGTKVQPNGTIKVTINVPAALKSVVNLFVYRVEADGKFTNVNAIIADGKIVFTTFHFSTYIVTSEALSGDAVVTEATEAAPAETTAPAAPTNPEDKNQNTGVVLAIVPAILAAAGVMVAKKRK